MPELVVAVHQPNFLPWLGFFDKMAASDVFVLLDNVQFSRGTRTNRIQILAGGSAHWLTVPVRRGGQPLIRDVAIDDSHRWRAKALRTLALNYRGQPGYNETMEVVEPALVNPTKRLAELNERAIRSLGDALSLHPAIVRASTLAVDGSSSDLLAQIVAAVGGDVYLSGAGATNYLADAPFSARGIRIEYQRFMGLEYPQAAAEPVRGLSVIDAMMSIGASRVSELAGWREGRPPDSSSLSPAGEHAH